MFANSAIVVFGALRVKQQFPGRLSSTNTIVPKFSETRKLCCYLPKNQTDSPNFRVFCQKDTNVIANSKVPDQTAPLGAV